MAISWGIFPPQPFPGYSMTPGRRSSIGVLRIAHNILGNEVLGTTLESLEQYNP